MTICRSTSWMLLSCVGLVTTNPYWAVPSGGVVLEEQPEPLPSV